nr:MAG TPA: hypothetical protein [Bacteriophage sp.]
MFLKIILIYTYILKYGFNTVYMYVLKLFFLNIICVSI